MIRRVLDRLFRDHRPHTHLDLLAPALLAEVTIAVKTDGERMLLCSKMEATPEERAKVVQAVIESGWDLARQWNIQIEMQQ